MPKITETPVSKHVVQLAVPTPTIPPAYETNTYVICDGKDGLLVDLGTQDPELIESVMEALQRIGATDVRLLATHYHRDHTQGLPFLQSRLHTPVYVHPLDMEPACKEMNIKPKLARPVPTQFRVGNVLVEIDHRPGHTHGHLHIRVPEDSVVLVGDHMAGTGSVWIGPPDGHLNDYYDSLDAVIHGECRIAGPGHGPLIEDAAGAALKQKQHRQDRERQILSLLDDWTGIDSLVASIYTGSIPAAAMWAARKTIQAHLQYLLMTDGINHQFNQNDMRTEYRRKS